MKRLRSLAVLAASVALCLGSSGPALASPAVQDLTYNRWENVHSGMCLGIVAGNMTNGTKAVQWPCGAADHYWAMLNVGFAPYYQLRNSVNPNKCLAVPGSSTTPGTTLIIFDCSGTNRDQEWQMLIAGNGYKLRNLNSQMLIAVSGSSLAKGAAVIQWPDTGNPDQHWTATA